MFGCFHLCWRVEKQAKSTVMNVSLCWICACFRVPCCCILLPCVLFLRCAVPLCMQGGVGALLT
jgi:hypothetical protein